MNAADDNIYLTGFMGAGKSTLGNALAQTLHRSFVDMDAVLSERFGMPLAEVFEKRGEAAFRREETALLREVSRRRRLVVATGGGVPAHETNRALMRQSGLVVLLDAHPERLRERLSQKAVAARPLWRDMDTVKALYESRRSAYAENDLVVNAAGPALADKLTAVLARLIADEEIPVSLDGAECPVRATVKGPAALAGTTGGRRVAILTDRHVADRHLQRYRRAFPDAVDLVISPGEGSKSLRCAEEIYMKMLDVGLERGDLLVALGGGVVTDFGAFVAATFKRGMPMALVSTSLLGCVDAAIGGKSAVNLGAYKNQVGLFTVPNQVVLDLAALSTLPEPEIREGLIEGYKTGLALKPELAAFVADRRDALLQGDLPTVAVVATESAKAKAEVVTVDFRERGLRRVLNLGHTYGHAVETWHDCRVKHGQCVAAGLLLTTELSRARGLLDDSTAEQVMHTTLALVATRFELPTCDEAWPIMLADKKNIGGKITFVLLQGLGGHVCVNDVTPDELTRAFSRVSALWNR